MKQLGVLLAIALSFAGFPSRLLAASVEEGLVAGAKKEGALDVTSELKEGLKLYPADPRWGDTYGKYVEEFREIFFK